MINVRTFSRIFIGLVFIFSGFVKGVDPLGTAFRIEDYLIAYGFDWALPFALFLSIALSSLEFILGMALLVNTRLKALSWVLFPLMIFFTLLTLYDAIYSPVPDCGCFGDAIKLTNWQTFYKNVVLIIFIFIIFKQRGKFKSSFSMLSQNVFVVIFLIAFGSFSYYQYNHLPLIDFREWKIGNDITSQINQKDQVYLIYQNKDTKEIKEFLSPNYPWNDSIWMTKWEFVNQRIEVIGAVNEIVLTINTYEGENITHDILSNSGYQFLFVLWDIDSAPKMAFKKIKSLTQFCDDNGIAINGLSSSSLEDVEQLTLQHSIDFVFYNADDIALKTMIRANPGLILLEDGKVLNKWHYRDFPDIADLENYLN